MAKRFPTLRKCSRTGSLDRSQNQNGSSISQSVFQAETQAKCFSIEFGPSARELVILSWGVPGQPGEGHVNGKTAEGVEQKLKGHGWEKDAEMTSKLQTAATSPSIRRNVQAFSKSS